jgi:Glycosyl transferase family 21
LVRRKALQDAGGISKIAGELIDDCALARLIAGNGGAIWLGLSDESLSLRAYEKLADIWNMVARTAFVQLRHSLLLLVGTVIGMAVIYLAPVFFLVFGVIDGSPAVTLLGAFAWTLMSVAFYPTIRLYGLAAPWVLTLPIAAALYALFTLDSARRHWIGRGGAWKGRLQDPSNMGNG